MERAPRNLAPNLWVIDRPFKLPYVGVEIGTRMTCIRLANGRLFLHSPVKLDPVLRNSLDALGEVRAVVAPNKLHHLFLAEHITSYPRAIVYAAPSLTKKRPDLPFNGELGDEPQTEWRGQIEQHLFRGSPPLNEVVFFHPATDSDRSCLQHPKGSCEAIASILLAMGCRALRPASVRSAQSNSRSAGSAKFGRENLKLELRPHNREPWRGGRDGWTQSVCGSVRVPTPWG